MNIQNSIKKINVLSIYGYFKKYSLILFFIIICLIISLKVPRFLSPVNIKNVMTQISINALLATGMTFVILTGGIDISVGSVAALGGIVVTGILEPILQLSLIMTLLISFGVSIIVGLLCGGFNAIVITKFKVAPFIATLGMYSIARGAAFLYTKSKPIFLLPDSFGWLGQGHIGFVPVIVLIMILVLFAAHIILAKTKFGRYVYAVGSNEEVAYLNGINTRRVKNIVYIISGILSAFAGVCLASRLASGQPAAATGYELIAIAIVVLGGNSMNGGRGSIKNTILGLLTIGVINNGLSLMQVSSYWQKIVMGLIIVAAVAFDKYNVNYSA